MLPFFSGTRERAETEERFLTAPVVIMLLLMISFVGAGVYVLVSTFAQ